MSKQFCLCRVWYSSMGKMHLRQASICVKYEVLRHWIISLLKTPKLTMHTKLLCAIRLTTDKSHWQSTSASFLGAWSHHPPSCGTGNCMCWNKMPLPMGEHTWNFKPLLEGIVLHQYTLKYSFKLDWQARWDLSPTLLTSSQKKN